MAAINKLKYFFCIALLFLLITLNGFSQQKTPPLERLVSIKATNMPVGEVLQKISDLGKFSFSYNTQSIDPNRKISLQMENKPVRTILHAIFRGSVIFKSKNNYIILSIAPEKQEIEPKYLQVSGYTFDKPTSGKLKHVSILEETTLISTISDNYGYFTMQVPNSTKQIKLNINKAGYGDTVLILSKDYFQAVEIVLWPDPPKQEIPPENDTIITIVDTHSVAEPVVTLPEKVKGFDFLLNDKMRTNLRNLRDTLFRKVQFAVLPPLSTNKLVGPNVVNNISFNLLAGYTGGVKYAEIGGLMNVDRGDVSYFQVAGLINAVGGKTKGFQAAGLINGCYNNVHGAQFAGLCNINLKLTKGFQAAGLFNYSKVVNGIQVAGLFNYAKKVKGVQLATFNFADSSSGIPIGFLSFVKHGYHKIELSSDELIHANFAFRTGVEKFHNIFTGGIGVGGVSSSLWTAGYGLGTSYHISKKLLFDLDLTVSQFFKKTDKLMINADTLSPGSQNGWMNMNNKIYLGIEWQAGKKISIAAGPTINIHLTDTRNADYSLFNQLRPSYLTSEMVATNLRMNTWIGWKIAIRFF